MAEVRKFESGATRDTDAGKNDYEGFLSPLVIEEFGDYMTEHRTQSDGSVRDSDNWQKGIPLAAYMKSLLRHTVDLWRLHRGYTVKPEMRGGVMKLPTKRSLLCSIMFNTMGYLHVLLVEEAENAKKQPASDAKESQDTGLDKKPKCPHCSVVAVRARGGSYYYCHNHACSYIGDVKAVA